MVAQPELVAHPDPFDSGPVRGASRRQAAVHPDAQDGPHPVAGPPVRGHASGFFHQDLQRRHTDMQRAE